MQELKEIENIILDIVGGNQTLKRFLPHIHSGKMLRSKLLLSIAPSTPKTIKLCAIIEMIQLASLLHDDVIDDALLRRGNESINSAFGNKNAIMLGDALYSKAFSELTEFDQKISRSVSEAVFQLACGEIDDVYMSKEFNADKGRYIEMIKNKTASLIASTSKCGAILSGLNEDDYYEYGQSLGIAFQIVDDILDIVSDSKKLGKPAMSDFADGKTTLPYIYLYESQDFDGRQKLLSLFGKKLDDSQIEWIKSEMEKNLCIKKSFSLAREYALGGISRVKNEKLVFMMNSIIDREF